VRKNQPTMQTGQERKKMSPAVVSAPEKTDPGLETSVTMTGFSTRNLRSIYEDLLGKLEENVVTDRPHFINDYMATMVKRDEMTTLWTDPAFYRQLKEAILNELLPIYDHYRTLRRKVEQKLEKGTWSRYCLWTIGICLVIEAILTDGRVLRPQLLIPAAIVDGLLGCGLWYIANFRALSELRRLKRGLLSSIQELISQQEVSEQYEVFRTYSGGELLNAELQQLLGSYSTPAEFWRDYYMVRKADPTTGVELDKLGVERFRNFLQLHVEGAYSEEGREQRFDALFLLAHKAFLLADRKRYVLQNLAQQMPPKENP
jgi:hypothetical protein